MAGTMIAIKIRKSNVVEKETSIVADA